ncbi:Uu.00g031440.m01.CDS01 [Anthostomella pinea]|uniref:Uu.00g031440.m01.CDS01 n=1 Tax=Anthostomella pinea TaxID=933095 RepID=A0AAI8V9I4_9PEZI|nr:Uu.00g031440.m01.CDS01 [Anthostomella pinea]
MALSITKVTDASPKKPTTLKGPFLEQFTDDWESRWKPSHAKKDMKGWAYVGEWCVEEPYQFMLENPAEKEIFGSYKRFMGSSWGKMNPVQGVAGTKMAGYPYSLRRLCDKNTSSRQSSTVPDKMG